MYVRNRYSNTYKRFLQVRILLEALHYLLNLKLKIMIIPVHFAHNKSVAISVIKDKDGLYSVHTGTVVNGYGMDLLPSYCILDPDDENYGPCVCFNDPREVRQGFDLEKLLKDVIDDLKSRYN